MTDAIPSLNTVSLCELLGVERPDGLADADLTGITTLEAAGPGEASFVSRPKFRDAAIESKAGVILVAAEMDFDDPRGLPVPGVPAAVMKVLQHFHPVPEPRTDIHATAVIGEGAEIGENVQIGPYCVIGAGATVGEGSILGSHCILEDGASAGPNCLLHPRVTIGARCIVGARAVIHSGVVIGADGFRFEMIEGRPTKMPQVGIVRIGDDVEIGANTAIDRASFTETTIGDRTKIDNLVQIGHNCEIGSDCILVGQSGMGGSTKLGRGVVMGGQAGINDNVNVGDGVRIAGQSGLGKNAPPLSAWAGSPAIEAKTYLRAAGVFQRLPKIYAQMRPFLEEMEGGE
jgi:UDP-3-O-[3-hydroxymyristoyl] glucosamine N-acyltransferase